MTGVEKIVEEIKEVFEEVMEVVEEAVEPMLDHNHEEKKPEVYLEELIVRYPELEPVKAQIQEAYEILRDCFVSGHKLLVAGNGGSAADA